MQDIDKIREKLNDEKIVRLELGYCSVAIQDWWDKHKHLTLRLQQILFMQFFLSILKKRYRMYGKFSSK
ncbi:MAG: hypothetical protein K2I71_07780 [Helicobacter sp.]|nr:hypothetical protein [Helicobacter sp.]